MHPQVVEAQHPRRLIARTMHHDFGMLHVRAYLLTALRADSLATLLGD